MLRNTCKYHIPPNYVVERVIAHRKPPDVRSCKQITDRRNSATRQGWSKGIGGGDAFMKLCLSSSGCETRPAKGEPARAGSKPCDGARKGIGDAEVCERAGHGACGPETYHLPGGRGSCFT